MTSELETTTLHELVTRSFCRTPNGLIFTYDLKTVYSVFLICLNLQDEDRKPKKWLPNFSRTTHRFSFSVEEAVERMKNLELQVDIGTTYVNISYKIHPELACHLLENFMTAKLLHTPSDRTRSKPKEKVLLQPTPKGVSVLQKYVKDIGLKDIPDILLSEFNSMDLFLFERNTSSDSIIHSDRLIRLLFTKIMGGSPNVWSPTNPPDKIVSLTKLLEYNSDIFTFESAEYKSYHKSRNSKSRKNTEADIDIPYQLSESALKNENTVSPFSHKFFTNPDSDAHVQYYVSDSGLRLFKSKMFGQKKTLIDFSFTTKAIWQWIMDCTDVMYSKEAVSVAALFLKAGLIVPILLPPSENSRKRFHISRASFYTLTQRGWDCIQWNTENGIKRSISVLTRKKSCKPRVDVQEKRSSDEGDEDYGFQISDSEEVKSPHDFQLKNMDDVLSDPGMRYLFRRHLENDFCSENLDAYMEIQKLLKKMRLLEKTVSAQTGDNRGILREKVTSGTNVRATVDTAFTRHSNECLEMAYHIYSSYIMVNSPYELNIDHNLRQSISRIMLHPKSPLSEGFSTKPNFEDDSFGDAESTPITAMESPLLDLSPDSCVEDTARPDSPNSGMRKPPAENTNLCSDDNTSNSYSSARNSFMEYTNICSKTSTCKSFPSFMDLLKIRDDRMFNTLRVLSHLHPKFEILSEDLHHLMKIDSYQKFLRSNVYQEALSTFVENK